MITFSIIIPVYNIAPYLKECLNSVLAQTFTDWEAICVDDGSTDGSSLVLDEYAAIDSRIIVFHKKNAGVGRARNLGVEQAKGAYVLFLDGDDTLVLGSLTLLSEILKNNNNVDILKFNWRRVPKHYQVENTFNYCDYDRVRSYDMSNIGDAKMVFKEFAVGGLLAWGACYRTALIKPIPFRTMTNGEDVLFGTEVICNASTVLVTDMICYNYLDRIGSAVNTKSLCHLYGVVDTAVCVFEVVSKWNNYSAVKVYLIRKIRTLLLGFGWSVMNSLPVEDYDKGFERLVFGMKQIFCKKENVGVFVSFIYKIIFSFKNRWIVWCWFRAPWKVRACLLKSRFIKDIWNKIR